ncbi:lytic polysaccharide monooxygenase [Canariomyces notabilis]|uniref:lytic cellulose monooxygenase (C4-dehydrogenating) n=1 Tax=Canariomyces notabilis TaxID=2074819 RepID=A0AAN6TEX0_9PEZI|nr:lytic polysaccharide monooxygenase [Canariomyces arenarius]
MDYLAPCPAAASASGGGCTTVSKEELRFVKVAQAGLKRGVTPATDWLKAWVTDDLIKDNFRWTFQVPKDLKSGMYVLRHEIIALHSAWDVEGVQAYPQCINLNVTDGGSTEITGGESATTFYTQGEPGLHINVYNGFNEGGYPFPGPALWR